MRRVRCAAYLLLGGADPETEEDANEAKAQADELRAHMRAVGPADGLDSHAKGEDCAGQDLAAALQGRRARLREEEAAYMTAMVVMTPW